MPQMQYGANSPGSPNGIPNIASSLSNSGSNSKKRRYEDDVLDFIDDVKRGKLTDMDSGTLWSLSPVLPLTDRYCVFSCSTSGLLL